MAAAHPPELAELLLTSGADVNVVSADGSLPLHEAVRKHNILVLKALVDHGSQLDAKDGKGLSPLAIALAEGLDEATQVLIHAGCEPESHETAVPPICTDMLSQGAEPDYWPRDAKDQLGDFMLLRRPFGVVELPKHLVLLILDLAEYWVKAIVSRNEAKEVDAQKAISKEAYLQTSKIAGRRENPIQKVRFIIRSHDQGWSSYPRNHGTYDHSWTWFDIQIMKRSGRIVDFLHDGDVGQLLTRNVHAKWESTEHDITYENRPRYRKCEWIHWLKPGDQLGIIPMAVFPGWVNYVEFSQIEVFFHFPTLPLRIG